MGSGASASKPRPKAEARAGTSSGDVAGSVRTFVGVDETAPRRHDERLAECFRQWDLNSSGTISVHELMRVMEAIGVSLPPSGLQAIFSAIDLNQDGVIDYHEFVAWLYPEDQAARQDALASPRSTTPRAADQSVTLSEAPSPSVRSSGGGREPLLVLLHSAAQLPSENASTECNAFAVAFVSKGGTPMTPKARWPCSKNCNSPCWNTTRDLGHHVTGPDADATGLLNIELWNRESSMIGEVQVPLKVIVMDEWCEAPLELTAAFARKAAGHGTPYVKFMIITEPSLVKKVFLIRHGESLWNKAQREKQVTALLEQVDHPLSDDGVKQCLELQNRIADLQAPGSQNKASANEQELLEAQVALASPLTRAVQTAVVGLEPLLQRIGGLRLCRNAREKRNLGGRDTTGTARGAAEIVHRLHATLAAAGMKESDIDRYLTLPLDATEAESRWWSSSREKDSEVKARMAEFMGQLRWSREERIIVVGHSHFFRDLVKSRLAPSASVVGAARADICNKKLMNCGVMAVTLDFRKGSDKPITEVELLLGTTLC